MDIYTELQHDYNTDPNHEFSGVGHADIFCHLSWDNTPDMLPDLNGFISAIEEHKQQRRSLWKPRFIRWDKKTKLTFKTTKQ